MRATVRPLLAEFIGTFGLVFIGGGSVVMNWNGGLGIAGIAFAHALVLSVMVTATMNISGGHLNPAVTFGVWVAGKIGLKLSTLYVVAQLAGAVVAALCIRWLLPSSAGGTTSYGVPRIAPEITLTNAVLIEALLTFFLVSAVFGTAISRHAPKVGGFGIGMVLFFDILVGGPLTGAAMNPARAFGPALIAGDWVGHVAFWLGPALGAALAGLIWAKVLLPREGDPEP